MHSAAHLVHVSVGHTALAPKGVHLLQQPGLHLWVPGDVVDAEAERVSRRLIARQDKGVALGRNLWRVVEARNRGTAGQHRGWAVVESSGM